jgi:hypothetical protein
MSKPKLKATTLKKIYQVDYRELECFVSEVYGITDYNFVAVEEGQNDSTYSFIVDGKTDEWDMGTVDEIRKGYIPMYSNGVLLNILCADGHLKPGNYSITVCW